jgi:hypothetical protein
MVSIFINFGEKSLKHTMVHRLKYYLILGISVSGFPNYLIMFGPNSGAPWANLTTTFEIQANYVSRVIRHIKRENSRRDGSAYAMMVEAGVQKRFNEWIQSNMGELAIMSPNCSNYYTVLSSREIFTHILEFQRPAYVQLAF